MRRDMPLVLIVWAAVCCASPGWAFSLVNAWTRAGAPLPASTYAPAPGIATVTTEAPPAEIVASYNPGGIFDEVRVGATTFWQRGDTSGEGNLYFNGQVLFDPVTPQFDKWYWNFLLRPRPHLGASLAVDEGSNQIFGGFTWTLPLGRLFFLEASFGATVHDAALEGEPVSVGCRVLMRETLGAGINLGEHWRLVGGVDHSSHANLCGGENDGLSHIGGSIGYRF